MKKNIFKGIVGFVLTVYAAGISCISVQAQESEASTEVELPAKYDSRDYGCITSGKSQYGGTCWAFASTAAAESSLIRTGLADSSIDLSEFHLAYYAYHDFHDPLGVADRSPAGSMSDIPTTMMYGGTVGRAEAAFSRWSGPVLESTMPCTSTDYYKGIYPDTSKDLSAESAFHLKSVMYVSRPDSIKKMVMKYGSVTTAYKVGSDKYMDYKSYDEVTYHIPDATSSDHEATIIGWDDDYPKDHFKYQPEHNGAWLVKDHLKGNEWWWISYETYMDDIAAYEFEPADLLANNYMHGSKAVSGVNVLNTEDSDMNIFTAKKSTETLEKLEAVMLETLGKKDRKITIYVNPVVKDNEIVDYEYKSAEIDFCAEYTGRYKVDIPEDIYLNDGDTFGIEVTREDGIKNADEVCFDTSQGFTNSTDIPLAGDVTIDTTSEELAIGEGFKIHGSVSVPAEAMAGISYTSSDPDIASVDKKGNVTAVAPGTATITAAATYGSDRKTCTVTVKPNLATSLTVEESVTINLYDFYTLHPVVDPNATNQSVSFQCPDPGMADVDNNGRVYARYPGTTTIIVKTNDGSNLSAVCTVKIIAPWNDTTNTDISGGGEDHATDTDTTTGTPTQKVVLNISRNRISIGGTATLTAATAPVVNLSKVSYLVSDSSVVSLNGATVTGLRPGTATITAVASDSGAFATVTVTVIDVKTSSTDGASKNTVHKGDSFVSKKIEYTVTGSAAVSVTGAGSRKIKSITIPATVRYKGKTYKVTSISSKAFYKCSKLKSITIKSKSMKSVGKNAFKGISKNVKVTVPKSKYNAYRKLFKKAGFGSKVTWKKSM